MTGVPLQRKEGARKDGSKVSDKQRVDSFPVASEAINRLMAEVIEGVRADRTLRFKLFQAAFHVTLSGEAMVRSPQLNSASTLRLFHQLI